MSSSDLAISARGVSKSYTIRHNDTRHTTLAESIMHRLRHPFTRTSQRETFWALRDVSFEVKKGEVLGIIGRNGAGKSTLLKILSRITEPTAGEIDLYGRVGSLLEVGTGFHQELTGRENIFLNGAILGMTRGEIKSQFDAIIDFAGIEQFLDTPVKRYSSGMYVRLAFAVAAHLRSEVLVIDEVLAVGDSEFQQKCLGRMEELARGGRTVLFVSHNMAAIRSLCRKCILLSKGSVQLHADAAECIDAYATASAGGSGRILEHIGRSHPAVRIASVTVNGRETDELTLDAENPTISIEMSGELTQPMPIALEARIADHHDMPLAYFGPGYEQGGAPMRPAGAFQLSSTALLPKMNRGDYLLHVFLAHPGAETLIEIRSAVRLRVAGAPTGTGVVFDYKNGAGWILLSSDTSKTLSTLPKKM